MVAANIIACVVVRILPWWIKERVTGRNHGLLMVLTVGIIGAFLVSSLQDSVTSAASEQAHLVTNLLAQANRRTERKMHEAVDKVIDEKKKEEIATKEAEQEVAADLNEAAHKDTKKER